MATWSIITALDNTVMQRQTAVTAYLKNKQLLLFSFALQNRWHKPHSFHFSNTQGWSVENKCVQSQCFLSEVSAKFLQYVGSPNYKFNKQFHPYIFQICLLF